MMPCLGFKNIFNIYTFEAGISREEGVEGGGFFAGRQKLSRL